MAKNGTSSARVDKVFVLSVYHFWTRNRQILNFEHFELVLACFYSVKRAFSTKWWPGEENAPKIIFFAFLVSFHINTTYIKLDWNSDNFLIFWCTLMPMVSLMLDTGDDNVAHDGDLDAETYR